MKEAQQELREAPGRMPNDSVRLDNPDVPMEARLWVLKCGITPELASDELGIMWSEKYKRVMVPVRQEVIIARSVHKEVQPKYILMGSKTSELYELHHHGNTVVLTEDPLSAFRLYQAGFNACAVLGTSITPECARRIAQRYSNVLLWLDADKAGRKGAVAVRKALSLYPITVRRVTTSYECDPKYLTIGQVRRAIDGQRTTAVV